jgi:uncharacterized protein (DUF3820 family)
MPKPENCEIYEYTREMSLTTKKSINLSELSKDELIMIDKLITKLRESTDERIVLNETPLKRNEFVYVITSESYYKRKLFKIGRTTNLKGRLSSLNTSTAGKEDQLFYLSVIPTIDAESLERRLHKHLNRFKYDKEWFRVNPIDLQKMVAIWLSHEKELFEATNDIISNQKESKKEISIEEWHTIEVVEEVIQESEEEEMLRLGNSQLCFGKYKGVKISEIPEEYLNWILRKRRVYGELFQAKRDIQRYRQLSK